MPEFQIDGDAGLFEDAEDIDVDGEIARYSFVTAEKAAGNDTTVMIRAVEPKDLAGFDGLLFQVDIDEEQDVVILTQEDENRERLFPNWDMELVEAADIKVVLEDALVAASNPKQKKALSNMLQALHQSAVG